MAGRRDKSSSENGNTNGQEGCPEDEGPACQPCRKKKSKCTRTQPCAHCEKSGIECVYDERKSKPGLRTGAVDSLTQRVVALEHMFLGQGVLWQQVWNTLNAIHPAAPISPESDLSQTISSGHDNLKERTDRLRSALSSLGDNGPESGVEQKLDDMSQRHKRRRIEIEDEREAPRRPLVVNTCLEEEILPADDLVDDLVEIYFTQIHPWIPILHVKQFRERMKIPAQRQKLTTIFHAIVSLCSRLSDDPRLADPVVRAQYARRNRQTVILQSMESFSVENLQALVICAFDTIGSGRGPSAWSIVGSMTRTVEQLQLSVEENDDPDAAKSAEYLMHRMAFLKPCKSWLEREERRRVFWNVFLMDRFCSVATGWNVSLTSADVKRRLPCEGALWEAGQPLKTPTPYFGIADAAAATTVVNPDSRQEREDQDSIGAFAYCIEATESLSLVTMFFLQHAVDISNFHDAQLWLMRFKELDLRLIQWKIFLPEKWREASVLNVDGILDPNLTLAHITHNTAVGLLHQGIAYPSPQWQRTSIRLPSSSSAETCLAAASEIAIIAEKFLHGSTILTNPQFAFCLFISGRMLLAHSSYYRVGLSADFDSLTNSLLEISRRWNGSYSQTQSKGTTENLASKFAARLIQAKNDGPGLLDIRKAAYSEDAGQKTASASPQRVENGANPLPDPMHHPSEIDTTGGISVDGTHMTRDFSSSMLGSFDENYMQAGPSENSPDSISLAFPPLPLSFQPQASSSMPSPAAGHEPLPPFYPGGMENYDHTVPRGPDLGFNAPAMEYGASGENYNDLMSFFEYPFLPSQRISTFSSTDRADEVPR